MSFTDEYLEQKKKKKKKTTAKTGDSFTDEYLSKVQPRVEEDIAPVRTTVSPAQKTVANDEKRTWFNKGAFDDGYQFGDISKTILGTAKDVRENLYEGAIGIAEKTIDAGAYIVGGVGGLFGADEFKDKTKEFIKKDLINEHKVAKFVDAATGGGVSSIILGAKDADEVSVLGEKSDSLLQSGGQLAGTIGLQAVGVPWFVTTGVTSFGGEVESAFNQGATYGEAGLSAAITAGAEMLTEKISGGISFGGKTLDDAITKRIARGVSNKVVRTLSKLGVDMAGEGLEEVLSGTMSAIGQKITYADDKELTELFSKEDALESFIGGAVLGGGMGGINAVKSGVHGVDYASGLTANEEKVVNKVYEDRVAEAEKNGKITEKEKAKIYDEVLSDMEKGGISTDTIEEVLGGNTYQNYQNTVKNEDSLRETFNQLNQMKQGEMTGEQIDLRNELKEQLREMESKGERNQLKSQLGNEVMSLVQGDRLIESYNERSRRGQAFEADLTKYNEKQKAVIQKAADSGILNNTRRTHEFVDMIAKISADKGVLFDFTNNEKLKGSSFAVEGKTVNGFVTKDGVTLNIDSAKSLNSVVGHEITHVLEGTELYTALQSAVMEYAKTKGDYQGRYDSISKLYDGIDGANIDAELTADLVGDYLFTDSDFINNLSTNHRNVFQKIYDEVKYLCKVATAGSKEAKELEKVKRAFENAYRATKNTANDGDVKYALSKDIDGNVFVDVTEDIFDSTNGESVARTIQRVIAERFDNLIEANGQKFQINKTTNDEFRRSESAMDLLESSPNAYNDKLKTIANADEILTAAKNWIGEKTKHNRKDDIVEFGRGNVMYRVGENGYVADVIVGIRKNGSAVLYDLVNIYDKKITEDPVTMASNDNSQRRQDASADGNLSQKEPPVKMSLSESASYAEITEEQNKLYQREMSLAKRKREANNNPELLQAMDDYSNLFSELRNLLPKKRTGVATQAELDRIEEIKALRDEKMNRVAELSESLGINAIAEEEREIRELRESLRVAADNAWAREGAEKENKAIEKSGLSAPEYFRKKALKAFKTTTNFNEAGYLLPDGKLLNFSGGERNRRYRDHREIGEIYEATNGTAALNRFLSDGNIRIMAESPGIDLAAGVEPTMEQYVALRKFINSHGAKEGQFFVDFSGTEGHRVGKYAYEGRVNADRVINDIKYYYANGEVREQSGLGNFLSLSNDGDQTAPVGKYNVYGKDIAFETAPVDEAVDEVPIDSEEVQQTFPDDAATAPIEHSVSDLADIAKQSRRENMRGAYTHNGKQYLSDGSFIAEFDTVDESLDQSNDFPIKQAVKELDEAFVRQTEGKYDLHTSDTKGFVKVGNSLFGTKRVNALIRALENPVFSLAKVRGGHEALLVTADNGRAVLMPVRASGNAYLVYEAQPIADAAFHDDIAPVSEQLEIDWRDIANTLSEPVMEDGEWTDEYLNKNNAVRERVLRGTVREVIRDVESGMTAVELAQKSKAAIQEYEQIQAKKPYGEAYTEAESLMLTALHNQYSMYDSVARDPEYVNELKYSISAGDESFESDRLNSLADEDAPPEMDAPYSEDAPFEGGQVVESEDPFADREVPHGSEGRKVNAYMYDNPEVKPFFQAEAIALLEELESGTKGEKWYNDKLFYESGGKEGWGGTKRHQSESIDRLSYEFNLSYEDIEKGLNAIIEDNGAENIAAAKKIEFVINDRLMYGYKPFGAMLDPDAGKPNQDYIALMQDKQRVDSLVDDKYAPPISEEIPDIAPVKTAPVKETPKKTYEAIRPKREPQPKLAKATPAEQARAEILTEEPKVDKKKPGMWARIKNSVLDKGMVFEDLSLATGNRELQARWNSIRYAESKAQRLMEEGNAMTSSLKSIRETVEQSGKTKQFYEYLYHKHNADRMTLAKRYKDTPNKPVFGDGVTAEVSQDAASKLEKANPEFKQYAQEVYGYMGYLREMLVDGGVISNETAKLWADMYPHYVPIRRVGDEGLNINVPLDTGKTGVNAPIKKATGGSRDILPLFDTMGQRTIQTYRAIAKNRFGVELKNTLGSPSENEAMGLDEAIDSVDMQDGLLQEGKDGKKPTFTVFENGERVTFPITEEMYEAMKPTSDGLAYTNKTLNKMSNIRRGTLTEYNPWFLLKNAIKDTQDVIINSQHPARTYAAMPKAIQQMTTNGQWYQEYMENGGDQNSYFDGETNTFTENNRTWEMVKKFTGLEAISRANNIVERLPRLAEYIASREAGNSVDVSMLDAARVTTNFAAGGNLTKFLNRNGATFLNASVQGAMQQARNIREAKMNGLRGWASLAGKFAVAGIPALILNNLMWDDDEEYENLSDYVKQDYYIVGKFGDGKFVRIPKGRTVAVIQNTLEQMTDVFTGDDEVDLRTFLDTVMSTLAFAGDNLAPNNPIDNNIFSPIAQVLANKTWYGEDLVPTRLQDLPKSEQYDESTDSISRWLGETFNISPVKANYLIDQYSGVLGDTFLPMLTPEAESGDNSTLGNMIAPLKDMFTTDSVMKNQNVSDFYETKDELTMNAKARGATDKDVLMSKYMNTINSELSELYAKKREVQNYSISDAAKYKWVREIQEEIDALAAESLDSYEDVKIDGKYATVGNVQFRWYEPGEDSDGEAGWKKLTDKQIEKQDEVTSGLGITASEYWSNKEEYDYAYEYPDKYAVAKTVGGYRAFRDYSSELYDIKADKDASGKSITGSRKEKVVDWLNELDADYYTKIILFKSEYNSDDTYNYEIVDYLNSRDDLTYDERVLILKELGFTVSSNGGINW